MLIEVLKSKLHCVTVTEANLNYVGSITIDEDLMDAANMIAGERVQIVNNNNGERFDTYIIKGERGSGCICLNGAAARKVQVGDVVKEINGKTMTIDGDISLYTAYYGFPKDEDVTMVVERDGQEKTIVMKPELMKDASGNENYRIGINHGKWEKVGVLGTLKYSTYEMKYWIETVVKSLQGLATKRFKASDVSGPVGIVSTMGKNIEASGDKDNGGGPGMMVMSMIFWCSMLSANLGVMNLLPIPALDGGRLLFLIIEWIRRKPMNPKYEGYVNMAGFMLLMLLMVVILGHDIINLF